MENNKQQNEEVTVNKMAWQEGQQEVEIVQGTHELNQNEDFDQELPELDVDFDFLVDFEEDDEEAVKDTDANNDEEQPQLEQLEDASFLLEELLPSVSNPVNRIPAPGAVSIVNSEKNGKRVSIAAKVHDKLNEPETLQVGFIENNMVLAECLGDGYTSYSLKKQGAKHIVYSKDLVEQITEHCELDFTDRTSITFYKATYQRLNGQIIAIISMN